MPDEVWTELARYYDERQRIDIVWVCAVERYFNSLALPLRIGSDRLAGDRLMAEVKPVEVAQREDRRDLELFSIDPPGSMDLDQAMHIERDGDGYVVHYAIADVAAFVRAGDPVDLVQPPPPPRRALAVAQPAVVGQDAGEVGE